MDKKKRLDKSIKEHTVIERKKFRLSLVIYLFCFVLFLLPLIREKVLSGFHSGKTKNVLVNKFNMGSHHDFLYNNNNKLEFRRRHRM